MPKVKTKWNNVMSLAISFAFLVLMVPVSTLASTATVANNIAPYQTVTNGTSSVQSAIYLPPKPPQGFNPLTASKGDLIRYGFPADQVAFRKQMGIGTFPTPPQGFNPLTASNNDLLRYGFPSRPPKGNTKALELWNKMVTAKIINPIFMNPIPVDTRLHRLPSIDTRLHRLPTVSANGTPVTASYNYFYNWSGITEATTSSFAAGGWTQPTAYADPSHIPAWEASWVGLGGYSYGTALIQDGTFSAVTGNGQYDYLPWYWIVYDNGTGLGNGPVPIYGFNSQPGDQWFSSVSFTSESNNTGNAWFYLYNYESNQYVSFPVDNVQNSAGANSSAEWIVERPGQTPDWPNLTDYGYDEFWDMQWAGGYVNANDPSLVYEFAITTLPNQWYALSSPSYVQNYSDGTNYFTTTWNNYF